MAAWQAGPVRTSAAPSPLTVLAPQPANAPAAPARVPESAAARAHPFAELLRQSRDDSAAASAPHEHSLPVTPDANANTNGEVNEPASTPSPAAKMKPRTATAPKPEPREHATDAAEGANGETDRTAATDKRDDHGGVPSTNAPADASTAAPVDGTARGAIERGDGALQNELARPRAADSDDIVAAAAAASRSQTRAAARSDTIDARSARADAIGADADRPASPPMLAAALAEATREADAVPHRSGAEARIDALASTLGASPSSPSGEVRPATATTELALPTPIDSPDFGAAFGVQVSVLAKDGVQHAELHLNPAETGPVSIQIAVAGSEARIDFGADLAATRAAIEKSLPELAAALRDAGLTLTGGGVSQHAGARSPSGDDAGSPAARAGTRSAAANGEAPALRTVHRVAAGGVDLYA